VARLVSSAVDRCEDVHVVPTVVRGAEVCLWWSLLVHLFASMLGRLLPLNLFAFRLLPLNLFAFTA